MPTPDRRTALTSAATELLATASLSKAQRDQDKAAETCLRYVAMEDKYRTLSDEWAVLESWLCRQHPGFVGMPKAEKALIPQTTRLAEIDRARDDAIKQGARLLSQARKARCRTPEAMIARLMVIERLIVTDENEEASALIRASLVDFGRHFSVPTWHWVTPWPNRNGPGTSDYAPS